MVRAATKQRRILVVEDQEEDFLYLRLLLQQSNLTDYELDWVTTCEAGLEALVRREHDVGIFDYRLGARTGLDLLREAKALECELPIILLTGHEDPAVDFEASDIGAADFLSKHNLDSVQLERAIRYSIRHAEMVAALRKAQAQMELFMLNVPCAVCIYDEAGRILFQNQQFLAHFDSSAVMHARARPQRESWHYSRGDRHWLVNTFPMVDPRGRRLQGFAAVEITERVQAEEQLHRTTRVLNGILTSLPVLALGIDENGAISEARGHGLDLIGRADDGLAGANLLESDANTASAIRKALDGGLVNCIWPIEHDGRTAYFDFHARFDDARGEGAIGFGVDVTQRVEAEAARNRRDQLVTAILRNLPIVAGRLDADGRVIELEGDGLEARGLTPAKLLGQVLAELHPPSRDAITRALGGGSAAFVLRDNAGTDEESQVEFFVFFDDRNGSGAIFFGSDVTDRKRLERRILGVIEAEQQRIGADLHDGLGQQLTGIACLAAALRDRIKTNDAATATAAGKIAGLVNEALAHTRALARGFFPVHVESSGLQTALEDLTFQIQQLHDVDCRLRADEPAPLCSQVSASHLYRIAQEAVTNAIRHGAAKRVTITLRSQKNTGVLAIEDDGSGFDPADKPAGAGVGIRLMEFRAALIGGTVSVRSQPGKGARIECIFPTLT